ncbi:hypothetical protein [Cellulomonas sp. PhB150]|uniref:hypothetical protein n=1 Tax=Cellulomonas sp. PhB150 TaxID=2485188 RepID=UPI000FA307CB|nr:hypothetical protein [Cellulomonas sp. PhB150]ROS25981.1 hypothetical protein EDF34_2307 [Cellulomonas sp. PhB150]
MSAPRPTARPSAAVYRRRRLVVLGIPLLIIVLVVWLVAGRGSADEPSSGAQTTATKTAKATPKATTKATPKPSLTPTATSGVPDCTDLKLKVSADDASYAAGQNPKLTTTITNQGTEACLVDAGTDKAALVITSGDDRVWSSQDCASEASGYRPLLLSAGESVKDSVTWKRVRSEEKCPKDLPAPKSGTYAATYSVGGVNAAPEVFTLG